MHRSRRLNFRQEDETQVDEMLASKTLRCLTLLNKKHYTRRDSIDLHFCIKVTDLTTKSVV